MRYDPNIHHRRSIRLKGYDYSQGGAYFITICIEGRLSLLGSIAGEELRHTEAGEMVSRVWAEMPVNYPGIDVDAFVVMPDHFHGMILIEPPALALPDAVHRLKSLTTALYRRGVYDRSWPAFAGRLWQRNYFERIIRDEAELVETRQYIEHNPFDRDVP